MSMQEGVLAVILDCGDPVIGGTFILFINDLHDVAKFVILGEPLGCLFGSGSSLQPARDRHSRLDKPGLTRRALRCGTQLCERQGEGIGTGLLRGMRALWLEPWCAIRFLVHRLAQQPELIRTTRVWPEHLGLTHKPLQSVVSIEVLCFHHTSVPNAGAAHKLESVELALETVIERRFIVKFFAACGGPESRWKLAVRFKGEGGEQPPGVGVVLGRLSLPVI
jgi:hypothetical protein